LKPKEGKRFSTLRENLEEKISIHEALKVTIFEEKSLDLLTPKKERKDEDRFLCRPCGLKLRSLHVAFRNFKTSANDSSYVSLRLTASKQSQGAVDVIAQDPGPSHVFALSTYGTESLSIEKDFAGLTSLTSDEAKDEVERKKPRKSTPLRRKMAKSLKTGKSTVQVFMFTQIQKEMKIFFCKTPR